ncbi:MAG: tRNA lysidine(34) synthetase TilS, partial [Opitutaceae bacterium]|nr:tRNA lysidine(34) synthetase TilS [Opitutaceae bacterium]
MARAIPSSRLHAGALREIRRAATAGEPVAVACSGGADSVALVCTLWAHLPELRGRWLILHFDHALRGRASAADARFVAALARGLGERCWVGRWRRSVAASASPAASEAEAREARFEFLARTMAASGARVLVLGHQADDVVETMLMRIVRGSATGGLAAPRPVHGRSDGTVRVRPLLGCEGAVLRDALRAAGAPWREDATNAGDTYLRNRVRRRVVPALRAAAGRDLATGFLAAREALDDDDTALEAWLDEIADPAGARRWAALAGRPRALARRAVHRWLRSAGVADDLGRTAVDALIETVAEGGRLRLSAGTGRFVTFDGQQLR